MQMKTAVKTSGVGDCSAEFNSPTLLFQHLDDFGHLVGTIKLGHSSTRQTEGQSL